MSNREHVEQMLAHQEAQAAAMRDIVSQPLESCAPYVVIDLWPGQWGVAGPDGKLLEPTFSDRHAEQTAQDYASDLNSAWRAGLAAADDPNVPAVWRRS